MLSKNKLITFFGMLNESLIKDDKNRCILKWTDSTKVALDFLEDNKEPCLKEALEYLYKNNKRPAICTLSGGYLFHYSTLESTVLQCSHYLPSHHVDLDNHHNKRFENYLNCVWHYLKLYYFTKQYGSNLSMPSELFPNAQ